MLVHLALSILRERVERSEGSIHKLSNRDGGGFVSSSIDVDVFFCTSSNSKVGMSMRRE